MKIYNIKLLFILLLGIIITLPVKGQGTDSLNHYLEVAAKNNPGLNADFLAYKASLEKIQQSGTW
ncbi:MAG: transporter, partial [Fermentimonas sp.]|nr:transporter [Fermentimonas sp.]MDD3511307.1 transporter [Fermentimonas sp.]